MAYFATVRNCNQFQHAKLKKTIVLYVAIKSHVKMLCRAHMLRFFCAFSMAKT